MKTSNKTVVITGASRGIGVGLAKECLSQGMNVAMCARSEIQWVQSPEYDQSKLIAMQADVGCETDMQSFSDKVVKTFGNIDLWVNNAGVLDPIMPVRNCNSIDVEKHFQTNILGVFHGTKLFIQHLRERKNKGVLINISSGASTSAYEGWGPYCASKAAVDMLTKVAYEEEKDHGLRAYAIAPGVIDTDMQTKIRATTVENFPAVGKFHEMKDQNTFSSLELVSKELLEIAFNSDKTPTEVCLRLPLS